MGLMFGSDCSAECCVCLDADAAASGGSGVFEQEYDSFGLAATKITICMDAFTIPDRFIVTGIDRDGNETLVYDSGPSGHSGQVCKCIDKPEGEKLKIRMYVDGLGNSGTVWQFTIRCTFDCVECSQDEDCPGDEICESGVCGPPECSDDPDCPEGEVCVDGRCESEDECSENEDCPEGEECVDGECKKPCDDDDDCPEGQICVDGYCEDAECEDSTDCPEGVCVDGRCVPRGDCDCNADISELTATISGIGITLGTSSSGGAIEPGGSDYEYSATFRSFIRNFYSEDDCDPDPPVLIKQHSVQIFCFENDWFVLIGVSCATYSGDACDSNNFQGSFGKNWTGKLRCDANGKPYGKPFDLEVTFESENATCALDIFDVEIDEE
jgi:hypothetical protein